MGLENYGTATELVMTQQQQQDVEAGIRSIRNTILRHGFAQEAVDNLSIKVSAHTLTISDEDRRSGAFHIHGDGAPFYAVAISAPGSMLNVQSSGSPTGMKPQDQSLLLAFEIGMNLMGNMEKALGFYGHTGDRIAGGVSAEIMNCNFETTMRCEPKTYLQVLNDMVEMRLNMIAPAAPAPKKPGRGFRP